MYVLVCVCTILYDATFVKEISDVAEIENDRVLVYVSLLHAFLAIIFVSKINVFIKIQEKHEYFEKN